MTKLNSRKVYAAVLGVAVAGFIADRMFLGGGFGPESASAAEAPAASVAMPSSHEPSARLSERVAVAFEQAAADSAALVGTTPDLFDPTPAFGAPQSGSSAQKTQEAIEAEFLRTHKLTALSDSAVVINGVTVRLEEPGDDRLSLVDGYRLTGIYRDGKRVMGAVLVKDGVTIRLPFNPAQTDQADH